MQRPTDFIVNICAVVGGIFAVFSIVDSVLRNSVGILGFGSPEDLPGHGTTQSVSKRQIMKRAKTQPEGPSADEGTLIANNDQIEMSNKTNKD